MPAADHLPEDSAPEAAQSAPNAAQNAAPNAAPTAPAAPTSVALDRQRLQRIAADTLFGILLFTVLLLAGWLAARHDHYFDWSSTARNSLSAESIAVLDRLEAPLHIVVYAAPEHRVARAVEQLLARYRTHSDNLSVEYVDPQRFPERARDADVDLIGQLVLDYRGRRETLYSLNESAVTNAIARLTRPSSPWVAVLEGHGERAISGAAGADIGRFAQLLHQRGFRLQPLDLATVPAVPDNTDLLLITTPSIALFPGEAQALMEHVEAGGNLLWLMDPSERPDDLLGLQPLADLLGIRTLPGTGHRCGRRANRAWTRRPSPSSTSGPEHPLSQGLERSAIFPGSVAFEATPPPGWQLETTLSSGELSWNETGPVRGEVTRDERAGEQPGPLPLALVLSRPRPGVDDAEQASADPAQQQRVIVVGDGDFLSNAHLANGVNQALALRLARWLTGQEDLVAVPAPISDSDALVLAPVRGWAIVGGGLIGLPALLVALGIAIRWQRGRA